MSVIEEKKALRTYIRQTERTLDPAYKAESSEPSPLRPRCWRNTGPRGPCSPLPAPSMRSTPRCC